jgi:hypothetical protein
LEAYSGEGIHPPVPSSSTGTDLNYLAVPSSSTGTDLNYLAVPSSSTGTDLYYLGGSLLRIRNPSSCTFIFNRY